MSPPRRLCNLQRLHLLGQRLLPLAAVHSAAEANEDKQGEAHYAHYILPQLESLEDGVCVVQIALRHAAFICIRSPFPLNVLELVLEVLLHVLLESAILHRRRWHVLRHPEVAVAADAGCGGEAWVLDQGVWASQVHP